MTKLDKTVKNLILEPQKLIQAIQNLISIYSVKTIQPGVRRVELCDVFVEGCYHPSPDLFAQSFFKSGESCGTQKLSSGEENFLDLEQRNPKSMGTLEMVAISAANAW